MPNIHLYNLQEKPTCSCFLFCYIVQAAVDRFQKNKQRDAFSFCLALLFLEGVWYKTVTLVHNLDQNRITMGEGLVDFAPDLRQKSRLVASPPSPIRRTMRLHTRASPGWNWQSALVVVGLPVSNLHS